MQPARRSTLGLLFALMLAFVSPTAPALDALHLQLGNLQGPDWRLQDAALMLDWDARGMPRGQFTAARLDLPAPLGSITELKVRCGRLALEAGRWHCADGRLVAQSSLFQGLHANVDFGYDVSSGKLQLQLDELQLAGSVLQLDVQLNGADWRLQARLEPLSVAQLSPLLSQWLPEPGQWQAQGEVRGSLVAAGDVSGVRSWQTELRMATLGYANAAGTQAGEGLGGSLRAHGTAVDGGWRLSLDARPEHGQLYAQPLFWDFDAAPGLNVQAELQVQADQAMVRVERLRWQQPDALVLEARAALRWGDALHLDELQLRIDEAHFPAAFAHYIQPWLLDTSFADLHTEGSLHGQLGYGAEGLAAVRLESVGLDVDDAHGRFHVAGLHGALDWDADGPAQRQRLGWRAGQLYRIDLGAAELELETEGRRLRLSQAVQVPVLDGSLVVDSFQWENGDTVQWSLDAALTPISMPAFSAALGWPAMAGTLSGMVPEVSYANKELRVGGTLLVGVFDGDITVRELRMRDPFGVVPRLQADIELEQLELEALTRTFAFGKIEGRLDGAVEGLQLEAWRPVAFDAWLATPAGDRSRHRISQKAVDNLSNIGGAGVGGALSRSFLRFLEDFPYRAIGWRCRLHNGVCAMGGVAPAAEGYYLVQGRTLPPRIDVIGYQEQVDWNSLLERLQAVTGPEGPVLR